MSKRDTTRARRSKHAPRAYIPTTSPARLKPATGCAVSLRLELGELRAAITGARMLADMIAHSGAENAADFRAAPSACAAVLALAVERLQLLDRVLAGDVGARALGTRNTLLPQGFPVADDVWLALDGDADRPTKK